MTLKTQVQGHLCFKPLIFRHGFELGYMVVLNSNKLGSPIWAMQPDHHIYTEVTLKG